MRVALGLVLILTGTVWVLQGLDVPWAPQSSMTGDWRWVAAGAVAILVGIASLVPGRLSKRDTKTDVS